MLAGASEATLSFHECHRLSMLVVFRVSPSGSSCVRSISDFRLLMLWV